MLLFRFTKVALFFTAEVCPTHTINSPLLVEKPV